MLTSLCLGFAIGIILALTGAGGGILAVPLLVFGAHQSVAQAGPISLLAVGMAAALGAILGLRAGIVRYRAALLISAVGMLASPVGLWLAYRVDNRWMTILFSITLLFVAFRTFRQAGKLHVDHVHMDEQLPCVRDGQSGRFFWTKRCARALCMTGGVAGILSGMLGVGGGFVLVPALGRFTDLETKSIVATSLAVITLVSASGVVSSVVAGNLNWSVAQPFAIGALSGMLGGRLVFARMAVHHLQKGFAILSALVAVGMVAKLVLLP
ncbi:MAG: sulfite exporter TauE/SafE family protein [Burkholderiaceae bacterium]|nr:sulfite exporter TauE/SafE family protein [Burkholderiaceae bacterium]